MASPSHKKYNVGLEIFGRIWALWSLVVFFCTMCLVIIFYLLCFIIKEPAASKWHRLVSRFWMNIFLFFAGCPVKVKGKEHFKKGDNYVVVCNHNSLMDVPVTTPYMPHANKTIAKKSFAYAPIFGLIYISGSVLIDRKNERSRRRSYEAMKQILNIGLDMVIYPEGTRNRGNKPLNNFHDGAFKLAVDTQKPVIPTLLFNTGKILPAHKAFFMLPHKIEMHFLEPVSPSGYTSKELRDKIYNIMLAYYQQYSKC